MSKHPEVFSPTNQEEEISQWQDWRLTFRSWLTFADSKYKADLNEAENFVEMDQERHTRAEQLHSIFLDFFDIDR